MGVFDFFKPKAPEIKQVPKYTEEQNELMKQLTGFYGDMMGSEDAQSALARLFSGKPSTEINPEVTEQFYKESIYDPAMKNWEQEILPSMQEKMGKNYWSSARSKAITDAEGDLHSGLRQQHGNLLYQDEQMRRQLEESALQRLMGAAQLPGQLLGNSAFDTLAYGGGSDFQTYISPLLQIGLMGGMLF